MTEYCPGDKVEYRGNNVGIITYFGKYIVMEWKQEPIRAFTTDEEYVFGMSIGLKEKIEESEIDYIEVKNGTIPVSVLDSYDSISKNDEFFNSDIPEDQILIEIPR